MDISLFSDELVKIGLGLVVVVLFYVWKYIGVNRRIMKAIDAGDAAQMRTLLNKNRDFVNEDKDELLSSYLTYAIIGGQMECVKALLELGDGAQLQKKGVESEEASVLNFCVEHASAEMLRLLLAAGMKAEVEPESPWMACCLHGKVEHARVLAAAGEDGVTDEQRAAAPGQTPLHAVAYGWFYNPEESAAMVRYLLQEYGADVNVCTIAGHTALDLAYDETHVGYERNDELRRLLTEAGGKRGRSLRVPKPVYVGRVFVTGSLQALTIEESLQVKGVSLLRHQEAWSADELEAALSKYPLKDSAKQQLLTHSAYVEVRAEGADGEDPVAVAERALSVLRILETMPGVVGVQFQSFISSNFKGEGEELCPYNLIGVALGRTDDDDYLLATRGMMDYGLPEVEIEVPADLYEGKKVSPFEALGDVLIQIMKGCSAIEPGHTMTLCGKYFSYAEWERLLCTGEEGLRVVMTEDGAPEQFLKPMEKL
ncbi:MAG: ankyrin repeat domain-containing protein [Akkermansia sp.]|nr:ankyrin repeat domain-containing protein [Akkermansia sp.]